MKIKRYLDVAKSGEYYLAAHLKCPELKLPVHLKGGGVEIVECPNGNFAAIVHKDNMYYTSYADHNPWSERHYWGKFHPYGERSPVDDENDVIDI